MYGAVKHDDHRRYSRISPRRQGPKGNASADYVHLHIRQTPCQARTAGQREPGMDQPPDTAIRLPLIVERIREFESPLDEAEFPRELLGAGCETAFGVLH